MGGCAEYDGGKRQREPESLHTHTASLILIPNG
jgi:hypothetical protein